MVAIITLLFFLSIVLIYNYVRDISLLRTVTGLNRGTRSERDFIMRLLKNGFSSNNIFHDLYIEKKDGTYSQVDIVVITEVGIIVVEVKDFSGWIFGFGHNENWVQILGKMKYSFYNPVRQNEGHIRSLKNHHVEFNNLPFYSLIVFYGNCELKKISNIPEGTIVIKNNTIIGTINSILKNRNYSNEFNDFKILEILNNGVLNGGKKEIKFQHIQNIKIYTNSKGQ